MHLLKIPCRLYLLLLCCTGFSGAAHAIEYDVELIIFEHARNTTVGSSNTLLVPAVTDTVPIPQQSVPGAAIQPLEELRLLAEAEKIKASNNHRLLYHGGWRQDALDKENAPYMSIALGNSFNLLAEAPSAFIDSGSLSDSDWEDESGQRNNFLRGYRTLPRNSQQDLTQRRATKLFGGIKVWVGRFLHFDTLLSYTPTDADYSFAFESERRMRSRQLHYIDHSRVGIITKIFPVDDTAQN